MLHAPEPGAGADARLDERGADVTALHLRSRVRLRHTLSHQRGEWQQRIQAVLYAAARTPAARARPTAPAAHAARRRYPTAAKLIAEIAGIERFRDQAKLARLAGIAPIPASSGDHTRYRLDRGGNRQLNAAVHRIAVTQLRCHPPAQDYIARRPSDGKTKREALRCLKRHLIRTIYNTMTPTPSDTPAAALALT